VEGEFGGFVSGGAVLLTVVLITLKVTDSIAMSWLWVLSPLWMLCCMSLGVVVLFAIIIGSLGGFRPMPTIPNKAEDEPED